MGAIITILKLMSSKQMRIVTRKATQKIRTRDCTPIALARGGTVRYPPEYPLPPPRCMSLGRRAIC